MRRPSEVWLAGTRWRIQWPEILEEADAGVTTDSDRLIKVKTKDCCEAFLKQAFLHEMLHACCFTQGGHWPTDEEHAVRLLERPLASLFEDERNAPLVRWLRRID
jgi:hypothetical protein